jgi:hypothetical protein
VGPDWNGWQRPVCIYAHVNVDRVADGFIAFPKLMGAKDVDTLVQMYDLFAQVHGLNVLRAAFKAYVEAGVLSPGLCIVLA